jgi:hypothetical protein
MGLQTLGCCFRFENGRRRFQTIKILCLPRQLVVEGANLHPFPMDLHLTSEKQETFPSLQIDQEIKTVNLAFRKAYVLIVLRK